MSEGYFSSHTSLSFVFQYVGVIFNHNTGLASAQVHRGLEINSSRDDIILILIVGYVCYSTITGGSSQHSAVVLCVLCVAASERSHLDAV